MTSEVLLRPDICVIGGGSGGLAFAAAAASFGVEVVLLERGEMGGDCLNYGCVPSKALLAAGKRAHYFRTSKKFGIEASDPVIDYERVHAHIHDVISTIAPMDSQERFEGLGVRVIRESGKFVNPKTVEAGDYRITARRFVIATGSSPMVPPIPGIDDVPYLTNETLFERTVLAPRMIIIGGGPIGMEMAQAHCRLGSSVTVLEGLRVLGNDDPDLSRIVLDCVRSEGVEILEGTKATKIERTGEGADEGICVHTESSSGEVGSVEGDVLLVAAGRRPNTSDLGLELAGIEPSRSGIKVDSNLRTTNRRVYAIGDVSGSYQFTHMAGYHAGLVIRSILFRLPARENRHIIPWCTYTDPELSHVGMTESQAREKHSDVQILEWSYDENDRAQAERLTVGRIKIVVNRKGVILGVSIVGSGAGEMISLFGLALTKKMKVRDLLSWVPPYPTLTEIGKRAATSYFVPATKNVWVRRVIRFLRFFG